MTNASDTDRRDVKIAINTRNMSQAVIRAPNSTQLDGVGRSDHAFSVRVRVRVRVGLSVQVV